MATAQTQANFLVSVVVGGVQLGTFDTFDSGETTAEDAKYSPGGMAQEINLVTRRSHGNVTVTRYYDVLRDDANMRWLITQVGKAQGSVSSQPLNADGVPVGQPTVYTGQLVRAKGPDVDSSSDDAAMMELEFSITGVS